jgi:hypothetical protein
VTDENANLQEALTSLESNIAELVAQNFLLNCRRKLKASIRKRRLTLMKVSTEPEDVEVEGSSCTEATTSDGENCSVIDGGLTVYVNGNIDTYSENILNLIQNEMDPTTGSLKDIEGIVEVIFLDSSSEEIPASDTDTSPGSSPNSVDGDQKPAENNLAIAAFASIATVAFVLVGFFTGRKILKKGEEEPDEAEQELEVDPSDDLEDFEEIPIDDSNDLHESGLVVNGNSILDSSGSVTVSSSFAK